QLPKIQQSVRREHRWLQLQMDMYQFDIILSDNRYGLHHPQAKNILLTHQLHIQTGTTLGNKIIEAQTKKFINKFDECWVVDNKRRKLAGKLSDAVSLKTPLKYIGWLSQFQFKEHVTSHPLQ